MCKHLNCVIQEEFLVHDVIFVDKGIVSAPKHDLEHPIPTGQYFVRCKDCGLEQSYGSRKPKWLRKILDKSMEGDSCVRRRSELLEDIKNVA